ncbi:hypothetical protein CDAR_265741 [Caerostris darwini]|uniref:Uncharacterized protein n=1 Tax=Caerostris darwini TaxID=1538125 RepID=A0AAV4V7V6_9ARAC|nr:hypothetical protein CDAR_265741 [Caerostris darwini]
MTTFALMRADRSFGITRRCGNSFATSYCIQNKFCFPQSARGKGLDGENTRKLFHFHNSRQAQRPLATDGPLPYNQTIAQHSEKPVAPESTASRARREITVIFSTHRLATW